MLVVRIAYRKEKLDNLKIQAIGKKDEYQADISKKNYILALFNWTEENISSVHILVNNAVVY